MANIEKDGMVNAVIDGVTEALAFEFPTEKGYQIYIGDVPQDFEPKSFIVGNVTASKERKNATTSVYTEIITIQYQPESGEMELNSVKSRLIECLEYINVYNGRGVKPTRTSYRDSAVVDGILTYMISVSDVYYEPPQGDNMTSASTQIGATDE